MKIISWNCRGAESNIFRRHLRELYCVHSPDLLIIMEPRISGERAERVSTSLGFQQVFRVDSVGYVGGIWLLWNPIGFGVHMLGSTSQFIHVLISPDNQPD